MFSGLFALTSCSSGTESLKSAVGSNSLPFSGASRNPNAIALPRDPAAIDTLAEAYFQSDGEIRAVLGVLLRSDFFKRATFERVKCPAELVAGTVKLVGTDRFPRPELGRLPAAVTAMGQELLNPPTVEGWHTGKEWIDGGTLSERVEFAVGEVSGVSSPGVRSIIDRLEAVGHPLAPDAVVDACLDLVGPLTVGPDARDAMIGHVREEGPLAFHDKDAAADRVVRLLQVIVSTREYQLA